MIASIEGLNPAESELFLRLLRDVLLELNINLVDLCVFASAVASGKALLPEDSAKLYESARCFHGLNRVINHDAT